MSEGIEVRWSGETESGLMRSPNRKMSIQHDLAAVVSINGEITVDARLIAPHLGLTPEEMMTELRCGFVYQVAEKGTAADEGRIRLTFAIALESAVSSSMPVARL